MLYDWSMESNCSTLLIGVKFLWRISQSEIRNSAATERRGRAKIPSPQPPSFLPARAHGIVCAARSAATIQFLSKKVRAELYNSTNIKLSDFCPTDSAARSAERYGNTGSPRTTRLAKRRFEIPCDFKYLLCPIKL